MYLTPRASADYSSVMIGIAFVLVLINWFVHGKKHYHGPRIEFHGPTHLDQEQKMKEHLRE